MTTSNPGVEKLLLGFARRQRRAIRIVVMMIALEISGLVLGGIIWLNTQPQNTNGLQAATWTGLSLASFKLAEPPDVVDEEAGALYHVDTRNPIEEAFSSKPVRKPSRRPILPGAK